MADDDLFLAVTVAVADLYLFRGMRLQLGQQLAAEAAARKGHQAVLQGIRHAPAPVMALDQLVLVLDLGACDLLAAGDSVLDELEDIGKAGQVEHQHDQALDTRRNAQLIAGMAQMMQKVAIEQRLALLGQTQCVVDLGRRLARHQAVQKAHIGAGHIHLHHEVSPRKAEQRMQIVFTKQCRMQYQLASAAMQDGNCQRQLGIAGDDLAHQISALVAIEEAGEHLDLEVGS